MVKLETIRIVIDDKEIALTLEQAKELREILKDLLPAKPSTETTIVYPVPYVYPVVIEPYRPYWQHWTYSTSIGSDGFTLTSAGNSNSSI